MVPIVDAVSSNPLTTVPTYEEAIVDNNEPPPNYDIAIAKYH